MPPCTLTALHFSNRPPNTCVHAIRFFFLSLDLSPRPFYIEKGLLAFFFFFLTYFFLSLSTRGGTWHTLFLICSRQSGVIHREFLLGFAREIFLGVTSFEWFLRVNVLRIIPTRRKMFLFFNLVAMVELHAESESFLLFLVIAQNVFSPQVLSSTWHCFSRCVPPRVHNEISF